MTKLQVCLDQHRDVGSAVATSEALLESACDADYQEELKRSPSADPKVGLVMTHLQSRQILRSRIKCRE